VTTPGCPACGTQSTAARWDDVTGFECGHCRGHFIPAPESQRNLSCTHCSASSFRTLQVGVIEIDACASCARVYFDADEATQYLRQARFKASGGKAVETGVATVEGISAVVNIRRALVP
jgi:Zn-finger nucleic acid-binding protein